MVLLPQEESGRVINNQLRGWKKVRTGWRDQKPSGTFTPHFSVQVGYEQECRVRRGESYSLYFGTVRAGSISLTSLHQVWGGEGRGVGKGGGGVKGSLYR